MSSEEKIPIFPKTTRTYRRTGSWLGRSGYEDLQIWHSVGVVSFLFGVVSSGLGLGLGRAFIC